MMSSFSFFRLSLRFSVVVRPSFVEIIEILKEVLVDINIKDPEDRKFWKAHFSSVYEVPFPDFQEKLFEYLKVSEKYKELTEEEKKSL